MGSQGVVYLREWSLHFCKEGDLFLTFSTFPLYLYL